MRKERNRIKDNRKKSRSHTLHRSRNRNYTEATNKPSNEKGTDSKEGNQLNKT